MRLLADWLLTACLGRDVVNPRIEGQHEVSQAWFEAGQVILAPGEPSLFPYVVPTGEVEVLTAGATETLRAGANASPFHPSSRSAFVERLHGLMCDAVRSSNVLLTAHR